MHLTILTPEKKIFEGNATGVKLPGIDGSFEILDKHAPIISALAEGQVRVNSKEGAQKFKIKSGFVEGINNQVTVLVEGAVAE